MVDLESVVLPSDESVEESYMAEELKRRGVDAVAELSFNSQQILRLKVYGSTVIETVRN